MVDGTVHRCPPVGSGRMPCCGRIPFEMPLSHRLTVDPHLVTCVGPPNPTVTPDDEIGVPV